MLRAHGEPLGNELDGVDVSATVVQCAAEVMVEGVDVAVVEAAGISDLVPLLPVAKGQPGTLTPRIIP